MTDYEIIKNLEACKKGNCTDCSLNCIKSEACITLLCSYAFELINCQQAEIEGLEIIDNQPAADVAHVRHGEWKGYTHSVFFRLDKDDNPICRDRVLYYCSECSRRSSIKTNYCPNCGAKMDKGEKNDP